MAAEMVGSAVAQEAVTQVLSRFKERYQEKSDAKEHVERLEMAHIKLEAALETSQRWSVTSAPLLRWRGKLKRAAQECDHTLRRCRQRLQEEEEVRSSSLPERIAHAARSLLSSIFDRGSDEGDDELRGPATAIRRFERFAEGAGEFLRYVELGGTPRRRYVFFDAGLVRHLLAGEGTRRCFVHGAQHLSFLLQPLSCPPERGRGKEGYLMVLLDDGDAPENSFLLSLSLRLSESTDVVGVVVRCLQLFAAPLLPRSSVAEAVKTKLTQLPTQDLRWVPDAYAGVSFARIGHRDDIYTASSKWSRPNPRCCQRQDHHHHSQSYAADDDVHLLEAVTHVSVLGHVALSGWSNRQSAAAVVVDGQSQTIIPSYLKFGVQFWPHASCEDLSPASIIGSATEMINNGEATQLLQRGLYANICFQELLHEILLPKATQYLRAAATSYQMMWRSRHGRAYLQVEKASWPWRTATARKGTGERRQKRRRPGKKQVQAWTSGVYEFMSSWIAHAPAQLQALAVDWIQEQERSPLPLLLKTNPCISDCPSMLLSLQDLGPMARKIKSFSTFVASRN